MLVNLYPGINIDPHTIRSVNAHEARKPLVLGDSGTPPSVTIIANAGTYERHMSINFETYEEAVKVADEIAAKVIAATKPSTPNRQEQFRKWNDELVESGRAVFPEPTEGESK